MMIGVLKFSGVAIALCAVAGCDTSVTPGYQVSPQNTIALHAAASSGKKAQVAAFRAAEGVDVSPHCRLMGPIDVGGGQPPETALRDALTAELLAGGMYSPKGAPLTVTLTRMEVSSVSGYWVLGGTVSSPKLPEGYPVDVKYDFKTSFSAISACQNSALAFNKAAAAFINGIVTHPKFGSAL